MPGSGSDGTETFLDCIGKRAPESVWLSSGRNLEGGRRAALCPVGKPGSPRKT